MPHTEELAPNGDWQSALPTLIERISNHPSEMVEQLRRAMAELVRAHAIDERRWVALALAEALQQHGKPRAAAPLAAEALLAHWDAADPYGVLTAYGVVGKVWGMLGLVADATASLACASTHARRLGNRRALMGFALNDALVRHLLGGEFAEVTVVERTIVVGRSHTDAGRLAVVLAYGASLECLAGRLEQAKAYAREAITLSVRHGLVRPRGIALCVQSECMVREGRLPDAMRLLWDGHQLLQRIGARFDAGRASLQLARMLAERGHTTQAYTLLLNVIDEAAVDQSHALEAQAIGELEALYSSTDDAWGMQRVVQLREEHDTRVAEVRTLVAPLHASIMSTCAGEPPWPTPPTSL